MKKSSVYSKPIFFIAASFFTYIGYAPSLLYASRNQSPLHPKCSTLFTAPSSTTQSIASTTATVIPTASSALTTLLKSDYFKPFKENKVTQSILKTLMESDSPREWSIGILNKLHFTQSDLTAVESIVNKMRLQIPLEQAWIELGLEFAIQRYINKNAEKVAYNADIEIDILAAREGTESNYSDKDLGLILKERLLLLDRFSEIELAAVQFRFEHLFRKNALFEGIPTHKALEIAHWLNGPYAKIETTAELREVLAKLSLEFPYGFKEARGKCGENSTKSDELAALGLFTIPVRNDPNMFEHIYLKYITPSGKEFIIDYSFNQFFSKNLHGNDNMPFVGTDKELESTIRKNKDLLFIATGATKTLDLSGNPNLLIRIFWGEPFLRETRNFNPSIIQTIDNRLKQLKKEMQ